MKQGLFLTAVLIISSLPGKGVQDPDREILMKVAGMDVEAGEFVRMFNKSPDPSGKEGIDSFLVRFVKFKLKVADAIAEGYDTTDSYISELEGYRQQLARGYLTDPGIRDKMLHMAYDRSQTEIRASHILVSCPANASSADTMKAFSKALDARQRITRGEPFEQVAREISDDKSVQLNGGDLGYFTVFQMIPPFEEAAYSLEPGSVSMPVRTSFGYHIIKATGKRPSGGKIRVAHIMKAIPQGSAEDEILTARRAIDSLWLLLRGGASFSELAREYSDHRQSAGRGGEMNLFGVGEIIPDFAEAAFTLKDTGQFTMPVRTIYGYHIIKLLERQAPPDFETAKPYLESKINQDDLARLGRKSLTEKLRLEYNYTVNQRAFRWFTNNTDSMIMKGSARYDRKSLPSGQIYSFAGQQRSAGEFAQYLETIGTVAAFADPSEFISSALDSYSADDILKYEEKVLAEKYPDFRYLMKEFHDGILLFNISSDKIWNKAQEDSTGLRAYFEKNRESFGPDVAGPFEEIKPEVMNDFQEWLNVEWEKQLKKKYPVWIDQRVLSEIKKRTRL